MPVDPLNYEVASKENFNNLKKWSNAYPGLNPAIKKACADGVLTRREYYNLLEEGQKIEDQINLKWAMDLPMHGLLRIVTIMLVISLGIKIAERVIKDG